MNARLLAHLATLRAAVGFLGEREQSGWWQSSFFAPTSAAFLKPAFAKTALLAQCQGAAQAAARIHDGRIGVGAVYHLFRLPEDVEQQLARLLLEVRTQQAVSASVASRDAAMRRLRDTARHVERTVGPVYIGATALLRDESGWAIVTGQYLQAFEQQSQAYPYFADRQ